MYYYTSATDFRHARREKSPHKRNNKRSSTGRDSSALTEEQQKIRAELNHLSAKLVKAELTNDEGAIDILKNSIKETRLKLKEIEESPGPSSVEQQSNVSPASSEGDLKTEINIISAKIIKAELENDTKLIEKLQEKLTMLRTQLLSSQGSAQLNEVQKIEESEPENSNQRNYDSKKDDHNLCSRNESVDKKWKKMKMEFGEVVIMKSIILYSILYCKIFFFNLSNSNLRRKLRVKNLNHQLMPQIPLKVQVLTASTVSIQIKG